MQGANRRATNAGRDRDRVERGVYSAGALSTRETRGAHVLDARTDEISTVILTRSHRDAEHKIRCMPAAVQQAQSRRASRSEKGVEPRIRKVGGSTAESDLSVSAREKAIGTHYEQRKKRSADGELDGGHAKALRRTLREISVIRRAKSGPEHPRRPGRVSCDRRANQRTMLRSM